MAKKLGIVLFVGMLFFSITNVFAVDIRVGRYVAGDSRNDLDFDYWILLNANGTAGLHSPDWSGNGTWSYDGNTLSIQITSARGDFDGYIGQIITFTHADTTGTVLVGDGDAWWLQ
jgi:hypothetical protein